MASLTELINKNLKNTPAHEQASLLRLEGATSDFVHKLRDLMNSDLNDSVKAELSAFLEIL